MIILLSCKKREAITEIKYVQPSVSLNSYVSLDLIDKTLSGYDTLVTFFASVEKKNPSNQYYEQDHDALITCNGLQQFNNASYPSNKGGLFYPNCIIEAKSTEYDAITLNDTASLPYFTNNNWWNFPDSNNSNQNFVIDFSSFKNYTDIGIIAYVYFVSPEFRNKYYNIPSPTNSFTITSQELSSDYKGLKNIVFEISFNKTVKQKLSDKVTVQSQKSIRLYKHATFY